MGLSGLSIILDCPLGCEAREGIVQYWIERHVTIVNNQHNIVIRHLNNLLLLKIAYNPD